MKNAKIQINVSVTENTDLKSLRQRLAHHVRLLSNPVRTDQGITTVQSVKINDENPMQQDLLDQMDDGGELAGYAAKDAARQLVQNWDDATPMDADFDVSLLHDIDDVCNILQDWKKALQKKLEVTEAEK